MGGFAHAMPGLATFFVLAGLSSLGLPGLAGFAAEILVFLGAWSSAHRWWAIPGLLGALFTAIYVLRAARIMFLGPARSESEGEVSDARGVEWVTLVVLSGALVRLGVWPRLLLDAIDSGVSGFLARVSG
jgi:NADH-quinone oxidoreductase subunit M